MAVFPWKTNNWSPDPLKEKLVGALLFHPVPEVLVTPFVHVKTVPNGNAEGAVNVKKPSPVLPVVSVPVNPLSVKFITVPAPISFNKTIENESGFAGARSGFHFHQRAGVGG